MHRSALSPFSTSAHTELGFAEVNRSVLFFLFTLLLPQL
jgi:hypothetical protein